MRDRVDIYFNAAAGERDPDYGTPAAEDWQATESTVPCLITPDQSMRTFDTDATESGVARYVVAFTSAHGIGLDHQLRSPDGVTVYNVVAPETRDSAGGLWLVKAEARS